jgi:sugar phosphate permease
MVSDRLISSFGWRNAWGLLGLLIWVVLIIPAALFMRRRPEDMGLRPDGDEVKPKEGSVTASSVSGSVNGALEIDQSWTYRQAMKTPTLWFIVAAFTVSGLSLAGIPIHQAAYMTDIGFSGAMAATSMSILAVGSAVGKMFWGFVVEKLHVRYCVIVCFTGAAASIGVLMSASSVVLLFLSSVTYGLTMGGCAVLTTVVYANYFGRTSLGTIRGLVQPFTIISLAGGPIFAGYVYDYTGSYQFSFIMFIVGWLLGALMIYFAKPPGAPWGRDRL